MLSFFSSKEDKILEYLMKISLKNHMNGLKIIYHVIIALNHRSLDCNVFRPSVFLRQHYY